jgi:hypothetical protein
VAKQKTAGNSGEAKLFPVSGRYQLIKKNSGRQILRTFRRSALFLFGALQLLVFLAATVKPAHAYVDPGSGLLFFQIGGSMLAGALFVMRTKVRKLLGLKPPAERESPLTKEESATGADAHAGRRA